MQRKAGMPISELEVISTGTSFLPAQNLTDSSRKCVSRELGFPTAHASLILARRYSSFPTTENWALAQPAKTKAETITIGNILCMLFSLSLQ